MRISIAAAFVSVALTTSGLRAADVTASVTGGVLRVIGSPSADHITISQAAVSGLHEIRVTPGMNTTVNGSALAQTLTGFTKDIVVETGGGGGAIDQFEIDDVDVPRDLHVTANVANLVELTISHANVERDLRVDADVQNVSMTARASTVGRDVRLRGSDGADTFELSQGFAVRRDVRCDGRAGSDTLLLALAHVRGRVDMSEGQDGDTLRLDATTVEGATRFTDRDGDGFVLFDRSNLGVVSVATGGGSDSLSIQESIVGGDAKFDLGAGANHVTLRHSTLERGARFRLGAGDDTVVAKDDTVFVRDVSFALGEGMNSLQLLESSAQDDLRASNGAGGDAVQLVESEVGGSVACRLGGAPALGVNLFACSASRVHGAVQVIGGTGKDDVSIEASSIRGDVRLKLGADSNAAQVAASAVRSLRVDGGDDVDSVTIGNDLDAAKDVRVACGNGQNFVFCNPSLIGGDLRVTAGSGDDTLLVDQDLVVVGKRKFDLGGGANTGP